MKWFEKLDIATHIAALFVASCVLNLFVILPIAVFGSWEVISSVTGVKFFQPLSHEPDLHTNAASRMMWGIAVTLVLSVSGYIIGYFSNDALHAFDCETRLTPRVVKWVATVLGLIPLVLILMAAYHTISSLEL
jgi:Na+/H+-translocating membrane pyrophosphatase